MSEQPQSIQPPDEPLDPYTLRVVIERLTAGIDDAVQYPVTGNTTSYEGGLFADNFYDRNDWQLAIDATALAREVVRGLLATANPRARVVVLPEPLVNSWGTKECGVDYYGESGEEDSEIVVTIDTGTLFVQIKQGVEEARDLALNLLAAVDKEAEQLAGGAQ